VSHPRSYSQKLIGRGVGVAIESGGASAHVAKYIGARAETVRKKVRQVEADQTLKARDTDQRRARRDQAPRPENAEPHRANEILVAATVFCATELDAGRAK
jgi:transposase-like protein